MIEDKNNSSDAEIDAVLVKRCQSGDLDAYSELVTKYRGRVYATVYNMVRNEQDAWDISQDAFVKAWKAIAKFQGKSSFYTWLYRIAKNMTIDWIRKRQKHVAVEFDEQIAHDPEVASSHGVVASEKPDERLEHTETGKTIQSALEKLSPDHRAVIVMKEVDGLQYNEIAEALGCSIGTVMSRIFYARKHLQKLLGDYYENL